MVWNPVYIPGVCWNFPGCPRSFRCIADRPFVVEKLVKYNVLDPFVCEQIQSINDSIK